MFLRDANAYDVYGAHLPLFSDERDAEAGLFANRNRLLSRLEQAAVGNPKFVFDVDNPESLKGLERWYFYLNETSGFGKWGRVEFECAMSMYLGTVSVRARPESNRWGVNDYFGRYHLCLHVPNAMRIVCREADLFADKNNVRRQSLWRRFRGDCKVVGRWKK